MTEKQTKGSGGKAGKKSAPYSDRSMHAAVQPADSRAHLCMVRRGRVLLWPDGSKRGDGGEDSKGRPRTVVWSNDPLVCVVQKVNGRPAVTHDFSHVLVAAPADVTTVTEVNHAGYASKLRQAGFDYTAKGTDEPPTTAKERAKTKLPVVEDDLPGADR